MEEPAIHSLLWTGKIHSLCNIAPFITRASMYWAALFQELHRRRTQPSKQPHERRLSYHREEETKGQKVPLLWTCPQPVLLRCQEVPQWLVSRWPLSVSLGPQPFHFKSKVTSRPHGSHSSQSPVLCQAPRCEARATQEEAVSLPLTSCYGGRFSVLLVPTPLPQLLILLGYF